MVFAFCAAASFLLVNIVDPYIGADGITRLRSRGRALRRPGRAVGRGRRRLRDRDRRHRELRRRGEARTLVVEPASSESGWAPPAVTPDPGSAQAIADGAVAARGWGVVGVRLPRRALEQGVGLAGERLQRIERRLRHSRRRFPGSKMASAGADWETNAATQIAWGLGYIAGRYGTPCGAWGTPSPSAGTEPELGLRTAACAVDWMPWRARTDPGVGPLVHARAIPSSMSIGCTSGWRRTEVRAWRANGTCSRSPRRRP